MQDKYKSFYFIFYIAIGSNKTNHLTLIVRNKTVDSDTIHKL